VGRWTDQYVDDMIGRLLRVGVLISAMVVFAGGCLYLARHGGEKSDRRTFQSEPDVLRYPAAIVRSALNGNDRGLIALGLLLLIATPVARVALAAFAFLREGDRFYTGVALFVLVVLLYSLAAP
jgi:uncharacterized membrane protein